jgi:hypothetical protein
VCLFSSRWDKNTRYLDIRLNFDDSSPEDGLAARLDSWLPSRDILTQALSLPGDENEQTFEALLQSEIIPLLDSLTVEFLASERADDLLDWALMSPKFEERLRPE